MEAARHFTQHEQPELDAGAAVRALGDRLVVERLTVDDERAARVVRQRAEQGRPAEETVRDAVEIGARVLEREALASEVDYVRGEFDRAAGEVRELFADRARAVGEQLDEQFEAVFGEEGGLMSRALAAHLDHLGEQIAARFDAGRSSAVQHQIRELVGKALAESRAELVRQFAADDGANPLADFKSAVVRTVTESSKAEREQQARLHKELAALRELVVRLTEQEQADARVDEAEQAGTRKGLAFEDRVHAALEAIADGRGDAARHTGAEQVAGGGKKGDALVEIGAADGASQGRIVFEVKDRRLSRNDAWAELNAAMAEREAEFAVLVCAGEERVPARTEVLCEYEGDKLVVAVDKDEPAGIALEAAYRYARARVLLARRGGGDELDVAAIGHATEAAASALKRAQGVRLALTKTTESVKAAREGLDRMVDDVRAELERIERLSDARG